MSGGAFAQSISLGTPVKNAGNSADNFSDGLITGFQRQTTVVVVTSSTTVFRVRYQEIVAADTGTFGADTTNTQASDYTIPFSVTAPGAYRLNISTSLSGAFTRVDDGGGNASVDMSGVTGTFTGGALSSGTLNLPDPGVMANAGGSLNTNIASASTAVITATSNGASVAHTLRFTWSGTCSTDATGFLNANGGDECALRLGLAATISGQTAGTYPGPGARTQALDGHWVSVTLENLCGNGTIDAGVGEQCDEGAFNGLASACCTTSCQFRAAGQTCRPVADFCDVAETCTGAASVCPANTFKPNTVECRASTGVCDPAENCSGSGPSCPGDGLSPSFVVCRSAAGVCDAVENCTGVDIDCPADAKKPTSFNCRAQTGVCDVADFCDGVSDDCSADSVKGAFVVCRSSASVCDAIENCDGVNKACPTDAPSPSTTVCRPTVGVCDQAENCNGSSFDCPPDVFLGSLMGAFVCRSAAGVCDVDETCPGTGPNCPSDSKVPSGTVCRSAAGFCDMFETCDGLNNPCPSDAKKPSTTVCRSSAGVCDIADNCTGSTDTCPTDVFKPSSTVCRSAAGDCDAVENCTGSGASCPTDLPLPDTDMDGFCDVIDDCPQVSDPGQIDTDNDGEGDACDICTNTLPSFAERQKVTLTKILPPGGDDKLKIQGRCVPFVEDPLIDPLNNGIRVKMSDALGNVPLDVTLPPGAYNTTDRAGWKVHTFPTGLTAMYKNAGTVLPLIQGIKTLKFVQKTGNGISKFKVLGKNGNYPVPNPAGAPVKVTLVAAPPISMNGQCCEMFFNGPPPAPSCAFASGGATLKCK